MYEWSRVKTAFNYKWVKKKSKKILLRTCEKSCSSKFYWLICLSLLYSMNMTETLDSPAPDCAKTPVPKFLATSLTWRQEGLHQAPTRYLGSNTFQLAFNKFRKSYSFLQCAWCPKKPQLGETLFSLQWKPLGCHRLKTSFRTINPDWRTIRLFITYYLSKTHRVKSRKVYF